MVEMRLDPSASVRQDLPADYNALIVVLEGESAVGAESASITAGDVAWLTRGDGAEASGSGDPGRGQTISRFAVCRPSVA